jgi:dihydrodipicolinate reductase
MTKVIITGSKGRMGQALVPAPRFPISNRRAD